MTKRSHSRPIRENDPLKSFPTIFFCAALGILLGLGFLTFGYGKGASYLGNDPNACANCHVMRDYRDSWLKSPHRHVSVCNDCHAPGPLWQKYGSKAINGFFHSLAFTTNNFPERMQVTPMNRKLVEQACQGCHVSIANDIAHFTRGEDSTVNDGGNGKFCTRCHEGVGHEGGGHIISIGD